MKKMLNQFLSALAITISLCAAPAFVCTEDLSAADLETVTMAHASNKLTVTPSGEVYYYQGDTYVTGKFSLEPSFVLGDVTNDNNVTAEDAAAILEAASSLGSGSDAYFGSSAEEKAAFRTHADTNENNAIEASDAAVILQYIAQKGANPKIHPLGFAYYYANDDGVLQKGRIDAPNGESYIAGEDHRLLTGWVHDSGKTYYLNSEGVMQKNTWLISKAGTSCWMGADGAMTINGWANTAKGSYYLGEDGSPVDGLQVIRNKGYYFVDNVLQTGWLTIGDKTCYAGEDGALYRGIKTVGAHTYYFASGYEMARGWVKQTAGSYYFNEDGIMLTGWQEIDGKVYYLAENGLRQDGFVRLENGSYYMDANGILLTGWQEIEGNVYYFMPETGLMATGLTWMDDGNAYYFNDDGVRSSGWQTVDDKEYYFGEDGIMAKGIVVIGEMIYEFDNNGVCIGEYTGSNLDINVLLNVTAARSEQKRSITVYDQQKASGKEKVDFTINLNDSDIAIIEQFLAANTPANGTVADKLYATHQWIHYNVDYAYAGSKWNEIVNLSYVDAIFNHRKGQCVQYNGAMASVLAYYGFDVYMVKGYTRPGVQHFWTEVELYGHTYKVECGNSGKNGDSWQYFFSMMF